MRNVQFNAGPTREALARAMGLLTDMTPVYDQIGEYMIEATKKRFVTGTAPDGSKWPAKSQATLDRYRRMGYGHLTKPLTFKSKALSTQILDFVSKGGVVIGSPLIYSAVHQFGAAKGAFGSDKHGRPIPWGRIPARTWLGISRDDGEKIVKITDLMVEHELGGKSG